MQIKEERKAQATIFIIIAVIIVAIAIIAIILYPSIIKPVITPVSESPQKFIQDCMQETIDKAVEDVSYQGGSKTPANFFLYENEKLEYLCYTSEYYKKCVMQQPVLKAHAEEEIERAIKGKASTCISEMKQNFENKGYKVSSSSGDVLVELVPGRLIVNLNYPTVITKDKTERYNAFKIIKNNKFYELIAIATSILNWEARYGDAETTAYMSFYPDIEVEKFKQGDGTTVYILTNRDNKENKFQFASRSLVLPPGYDVSGVVF